MKIPVTVVALFALLLLIACGGGSGHLVVAPVFTSAPVTAASEGAPYAYQIAAVDPTGKSVTFAIVAAPNGTALSGNTITWTPTPAQSRVQNDFTVSAISAEGGRATQSWSVMPSGTVHLTANSTFWTSQGPTTIVLDWTGGTLPGVCRIGPSALVPLADGSYQALEGSGTSDGTYSIPNVPGGYFWLVDGGTSYWTSSGNIDLGGDIGGPYFSSRGNGTTTFQVDVDGLDPIKAGGTLSLIPDFAVTPLLDNLVWFVDPSSGTIFFPPPSGYTSDGTTYSGAYQSPSSHVDYSQVETALVAQYNPVPIGTETLLALGPVLEIASPPWTNGGTNSISGTLRADSRTSFDLNIKGSAWAALLENVAPSPVQYSGSLVDLVVQPFITKQNVLDRDLSGGRALQLVTPQGSRLRAGDCRLKTIAWWGGSETEISPIDPAMNSVLADQDSGTIRYNDPFQPDWGRVFSFCQFAKVTLATPNVSTPQTTFTLGYGTESAVPSRPVSPVVGPVRNPTINGDSLMVSKTLTTASATMSWTAPSVGTPSGYQIWTFSPSPDGRGSEIYSFGPVYTTAKTSVTIPLAPGKSYIFEIVALIDGAAKVETSPNRSALPRGYAAVLSAPITVSSSAPARIIKNDPNPPSSCTSNGGTTRPNGVRMMP